MRPLGFGTRALGHGQPAEPVVERPLSPPLYQSSTFAFDDIDRFSAASEAKFDHGYVYTRWSNPTLDALARTLADLEGAAAAACFASGMAAIHCTLASLLAPGDEIVCARQIYGGTFSLLRGVFERWGVGVRFVDITDHGAVEAQWSPRTRVLYAETIGNPVLPVADLGALGTIAHAHGAVLVVDSTFTPPFLLRPLEHGADFVIHSATKYLGGHADLSGGLVLGRRDEIDRIRHLAIDYGPVLGPFEAWLTLRGVQTLALRLERMSANALSLGQFFETCSAVRRVIYPGLPSHAQYDLAVKLMGERCGAMLVVDLGTWQSAREALEKVGVVLRAASLGGTKTVAVHPASVTHTQLSAAERHDLGIGDGILRISVGIEDIDDLVADFEQALS